MGYLVIGRRVHDRITIGDEIEILISDIQIDENGNAKVDVAVKAPKDVSIKRKESHWGKARGVNVRYKPR